MKNLTFLSALVFLLCGPAHADNVRYRTPALSGKLIASNLEMTDWQTVMSCHFNFQGSRKESIRYPQTWLKKSENGVYALKVKAGSLSEMLPRWDLLTCAYKLILIGKNTTTHQLAFGEIYLMGKESGVMSESELQTIMDLAQVTKILNEKTRELKVGFGPDGGIVEE